MSRVTYPHLGTLHITAEHFFRALGLEPITPPSPTRRTLDLGVTHCPEMTCAPCKILFGNYYEGLELGADRLVLFGGPDTCRLGYLARPHAQQPVRIAGRCTVFAESDMIHKQQMGHRMEDILYGLCQALARNFLNNLALGKELRPPVVFQGGVAANAGMVRAFEETLEMPVLVPPHYEVMGAIGAAMLAHEYMSRHGDDTRFQGFAASEMDYPTRSFECQGCSNLCEVVEIRVGHEVLARWGGRCGKWEM